MARRRNDEIEAFWRDLIEQHTVSDLTVEQCCNRAGVSTASFYAWKRRLRGRPAKGAGGAPTIYFLSKIAVCPDPADSDCGSSSSSSSSSASPQRRVDTTICYTWWPGTCQVQEQITTLPVVSEQQNGSGVAAQRRDYFDLYSYLTWQMDERGFVTRLEYDIPTGALTRRVDDVDTAVETDHPPGWE